MYRWEGEGEECVYVCCVDWKRKRKGEQEREWPAKERKEGVDCVMGSGVRWGARGNQTIWSFFFFFNWWDVTPMTLCISMWMHVYGIKIRQHKINEQPYVCKQDYAHVSFCSETLETQQRLKTLNLTS